MNVYIGGTKDYSAMQGPAPSGFHVPLKTEWEGLKTIMTGLGLTTGDSWRINLHMPFAGQRNSNSSTSNQGSDGFYWSSSPFGDSRPDSASLLGFGASYVVPGYGFARALGFSIRCFKNSYETPTSSWTVINGTLGSAGIFWDTVNGLISITADGTTGYTIQDKNLGATTVYNNGNTLSEANCGKYYQWGNNYGFAWTGSITTSSTQVNASAYGPGNYYSSSTFITGSDDWSSVHNNNLRGGVTGIVSPAPLKNAYIGEVYDMQIDFRGKTLAQLQSLGWAETKYSSDCGLSYGSDGIGVYVASGYLGVGGVVLELPRVITSSDKITMRFTGVGGSGDTGRLFCSLANTNTINLLSNNMIEADFAINVGSNAAAEGISCNKNVNGTKNWGVYELNRSKAGSSGFASGECIFDLPNNKAYWNVTAPSSQVYSMEGTITTEGKNCIIGTKYFAIWVGVFTSGVTQKLQTASITIE